MPFENIIMDEIEEHINNNYEKDESDKNKNSVFSLDFEFTNFELKFK
jgi:hypothetical protein